MAAFGRKLLAESEATKTIFNNGWAPDCGWWASGAYNISIVPGAGVGQSNGLCTTFPEAEVSGPYFSVAELVASGKLGVHVVPVTDYGRETTSTHSLPLAYTYLHQMLLYHVCLLCICFSVGLDVISLWWLRWPGVCFEQVFCC